MAVYEQQRLQTIHRKTFFGQQPPTSLALNRGEFKRFLAVMPQDELHPAVAEQALGIENDNQVGSFERTSRWPR